MLSREYKPQLTRGRTCGGSGGIARQMIIPRDIFIALPISGRQPEIAGTRVV